MLRLMIESWFTYDHSLLWHYIVSICQAIEHILDIDMPGLSCVIDNQVLAAPSALLEQQQAHQIPCRLTERNHQWWEKQSNVSLK